MNPKVDDAAWMQLAIEQARSGNPSPNPHVGAVIVSAIGEIVGRGFHMRRGLAHAEVMAIEQADERAIGGTLYVTLEPCNHHGQTPPCVDAILAAKLARVVVGCTDPNPHVAGGGAGRLAECGIDVRELNDPRCIDLIAPFAKFARNQLPFVRLKLATSLDGRIASHTGVSKWITSGDSRERVHRLRTIVDAVAVGIGTAIADDPELTARACALPPHRDPATRVVFDTRGRLPVGSKLVQTARQVPTWIVVGNSQLEAPARQAFTDAGLHVVETICDARGHVDLRSVLQALGQNGVLDILVEGGAHLAGALIENDLVDEIHWFVAPIFLGANALPSVVGPDPKTPSEAMSFKVAGCELLGDEVHLTLRKRPNS
jgi:diaminohydroxyphosphoribosylaminopyrimidine deaminase/5-amino-6-(5-phosphoribosylamino)uracil reductase